MADNRIISYLRNNGHEIQDKYGLTKLTEDKLSIDKVNTQDITKKLILSDLSAIRALQQIKEQKQRELDDMTRRVREARIILEETSEKLDAISDPQKIIKKKEEELSKVLKSFAIRHVEYKEHNVFIFTTEYLKFQGMLLGYFRIWMDFSYDSASSGLRIVNFYKRNGSQDHPCISNGNICMGNSSNAFQDAWKTKNIFNILEVCMAFLTSENVSHGYIRDWKVWNNGCRRVNRAFDFSTISIRPARTSLESSVADLFERLVRNLSL